MSSVGLTELPNKTASDGALWLRTEAPARPAPEQGGAK
jgi:hypothetical protein